MMSWCGSWVALKRLLVALKSWEKFYRACLPAWGGLFSHLFSLMVAIAAIFHVQPSLRRSRSQRHSKATTTYLKNSKISFRKSFLSFTSTIFNSYFSILTVNSILDRFAILLFFDQNLHTDFWSKIPCLMKTC